MEELINLATKLTGAPLSVSLIIAIVMLVRWWRHDLAKYEARELQRQAREDELYMQYASLLRESVAAIQKVADAMDRT